MFFTILTSILTEWLQFIKLYSANIDYKVKMFILFFVLLSLFISTISNFIVMTCPCYVHEVESVLLPQIIKKEFSLRELFPTTYTFRHKVPSISLNTKNFTTSSQLSIFTFIMSIIFTSFYLFLRSYHIPHSVILYLSGACLLYGLNINW